MTYTPPKFCEKCDNPTSLCLCSRIVPMTHEKSPEQMAEAWSRNHHSGPSTYLEDAYLAGFQEGREQQAPSTNELLTPTKISSCDKSPEQMDIGDANWQKYEAAFVKKTPEQMAKEWRHENTPASSEVDYWADKAYLAGFQKNDATVAQPLREWLEGLRLDYERIQLQSETELAALTARVSSLTAALEKISNISSNYETTFQLVAQIAFAKKTASEALKETQ